MDTNTSKGNVVIEFSVYIFVVITFISIFIDFFQLSIKLNNSNKMGNLISYRLSKTPKSIIYWSQESVKQEILNRYNLNTFTYQIQCSPVNCSTAPESVEVVINGNFWMLGFNIPINISKQAAISKFTEL
ncbi:MAG: hypothetical protein RIS18_568 [Actinomycetota bacterium]|jgi:hypothetical protein